LAIAVVVLIGIAWLAWGASFSTFLQSTTLALSLRGGAIYMLRQAKAQHLSSLEDVFQADPVSAGSVPAGLQPGVTVLR
jgi:hypothetical protein